MASSEKSITVTPEILDRLKNTKPLAFDAIMTFLADPTPDEDVDENKHPLFFNSSKNTDTFDYVPQNGYGFHRDGKKLHAFTYDCITKNRSKDLFGAKIEQFLDVENATDATQALFLAADTIAAAFLDLVQVGNDDTVSYAYLSEMALQVVSDDIKDEIGYLQHSPGVALGLVTELLARADKSTLFIKATQPREEFELSGLEALNERYIVLVYAYLTPMQQTQAVLTSIGINDFSENSWAQKLIDTAPNLDKLVQMNFEDLQNQVNGARGNDLHNVYAMYAGMYSRPEDIEPPPIRKHMLNSGVEMEVAAEMENRGHFDLDEFTDKDVYKIDETIFGDKFEFANDTEKEAYFEENFGDNNYNPDTYKSEDDKSDVDAEKKEKKKKYKRNKTKRDRFHKNDKNIAKKTMKGRQASLKEGRSGRKRGQRFKPGKKRPPVKPLTNAMKGGSVGRVVGKVGASTAAKVGASTALSGMAGAGALASSVAAMAGPIGLVLALAPMIKDLTSETEQAMTENIANSNASREQAVARVVDLLESVNLDDTSTTNKDNMEIVKQLLSEVQKPDTFGKNDHKGLELQKELEEMGMRLVANDTSALMPYNTDAELVAAIDSGRMLKALCLYIDADHPVLRPQRQLLDTPDFVKVMGVSRPFQSLRAQTTSETTMSSFVSSTSTSGFTTATMTSNSSSVNVSGSVNIGIAGGKGEHTRARQHTSEKNSSRSNTNQSRSEKETKTKIAVVSEFIFQPMKVISLLEGGLILTVYAYYRLQRIISYQTALEFLKDFGSHIPFGDHTVGGVFIRTMKITTKDEKSSTEMYAAASNELTVVNKQASTNQTEATKKVGLFGLGGSITATHSVSSASASGYTNTNMESQGKGSSEANTNASFESSITCFGPNAATPDSMYEQLMSNNATWTIIDRGEPDSYFAIWDLIDYIGQGGTFKEQVKWLKNTWEELALANSYVENHYLLEKLMEDYPLKKRMVDLVGALASCIVPKKGLFTGELAEQFEMVVLAAVEAQKNNQISTSPNDFIDAGFGGAKIDDDDRLFFIVKNCEIYEEVQEYIEEFDSRDWGLFIYHSSRWKAEILEKGKPLYLLLLFQDCHDGIDNWNLVREFLKSMKSLKRYAAYQKEEGSEHCLQYCIHANNIRDLSSIFDIIVTLFEAYPLAMDAPDWVETCFERKRNAVRFGFVSNVVADETQLTDEDRNPDWTYLKTKITGLDKFTSMEDFSKNIERMRKFVENLSSCIAPTQGSFVEALAIQFGKVVNFAMKKQESGSVYNSPEDFVQAGFEVLENKPRQLFKVVEGCDYYNKAKDSLTGINGWFGFQYNSAQMKAEILRKGEPNYLTNLRRDSQRNDDNNKSLVDELQKPLVSIDFSDNEDTSKYDATQAKFGEDPPIMNAEKMLRCENGDGEKHYAIIEDIDISPSNMPDCTLTVGVYIVDIPNSTGNQQSRGYILNNDNDGWERAIIMHYDENSKPFLSLGDEETSKSNIWGERQMEVTGSWIHVCAVFRNRGDCFMYIDREKSEAMHEVLSKSNGGLMDLIVGDSKNGLNDGCNCWVKEVKVYNRALSDEEVFASMDAFQENLAWLPVVEIDFGNPQHDTKYEIHGAEYNDAPDGIGRALLCDNSTTAQYAKIPNCDISPSKMKDCTIMIGCYVVNKEPDTRGLIVNNEHSNWDRAISLYERDGKPSLRLGKMPTDPWGSDEVNFMERWMYVTAVFREGGENLIFIDKVKSSKMTKDNDNPQDGRPDLYIGTAKDKLGYGCNCWVKELKVFGRALSDQEIYDMSDAFGASFTPIPLASLTEGLVKDINFGDSSRSDQFEKAGGADVLHDPPSISGSALRCKNDGESGPQYVKIPGVNISPSNMPECTVLIGVYVESIDFFENESYSRFSYGSLVISDNGVGKPYDRGFGMHSPYHDLKPAMSVGKPSNNVWRDKNIEIPGKWIHVAAVFQHGGDNYMFLDEHKSAIAEKDDSNEDGADHILIGGLDTTRHELSCNCWVKEVKVYERVLSDEEIRVASDWFHTKYNVTTPRVMEGTLTLPLPFKEAIFNDPNQENKGKYELIRISGAVNVMEGAEVKEGAPFFGGRKALRCEPSLLYAKIPDCNISPSQMPDCTITAGVYIVSKYGYSFIFDNDSSWFRGISMTRGDKPLLFLGDPTTSNVNIWGHRTFNVIGKWIHVTAVYRKDGDCFLYFDKEKSTATREKSVTTQGSSDLWVGRETDGWIKEVKVFDKALSDAEVFALSDQFHRVCLEQTEA